MANTLLVGLVLAVVASLGAGVALHASDAPPNLVTVEGKVINVEWNPHFNVSVEFTLQAANGTKYHVELGPPWWWAEHDLPTVKVNDTVTVKGEFEEGDHIQAWSLSINGGPVIEIRGLGMPPWAEERSGRTAEHPEASSDSE